MSCRRAVVLCVALSGSAAAQTVTWRNLVTLYGDNTEFFTPYRVGETILGGQFQSFLEVKTGERTRIIAGVFGDHRSGASNFLDPVKPLISFRYQKGSSTGVFGTLETYRRHGLLEPLEVTTLELTRPVEYGLQWIERRGRWDAEVFLNWQALNTETQREVFDYGAVIRFRPTSFLSLETQLHGLHHGGQLFDAGVPLTNNVASGFGITLSDTLGVLGRSALTVYRLRSSGNIDPNAPPGRPKNGHGYYVRASVAPRNWFEVFGIYWDGKDFLSDEGDHNYNSVGVNPSFYRSRRKYRELGVLRRTEIEAGVTFDAEFRVHRIDNENSIAFLGTKWEYSYRLVVRAPFAFVLHKS